MRDFLERRLAPACVVGMVVSLLLAIHTGKAVQWIKAHPNFSIVVMAVMIAVPVTCALYLLIKEMDDDINQH